MNNLKRFLFFLFINIGSLGLGSLLMNNGPTSEWYLNLNKAPWTPPGWLFGVAWTTIMVCFSIYLTYLFSKLSSKNIKIAFSIQVFLNIIWNFIFFNQHLILLGLITIILLTIVVFYIFFSFKNIMKTKSLLLLPYMIWLLIATSLNAYILINN
ncbi:tryptophan-rich sensory protein [Mesoflavibacter sabulilitoris]|uniref:TspO protein n=1 Tax=Mesoflavibacter zeaxanthinifaciens subsp. sabulilitoris TaxID=1520893 RepID=A0A2T1NHI5_9FLAO|nr:TspO/MBR family protein [Mesoflavibacter zeaxanthinifaciens]MBB3122656.1 tryptophan-rich sensory protein [Mesoflavibacter zeaxanthinifaciens subsp. sabulilitoris]PSG92252.1 TspO protein [Mesoflavibacter zeaxanthinifaciens subsp. sabulilitoris]